MFEAYGTYVGSRVLNKSLRGPTQAVGKPTVPTKTRKTTLTNGMCTMDGTRDSTGSAVIAKAVTFRVEMHRPTAGQKAAGYQVELAFLQEKGALSSFKLVLNRLRREWELDALDRICAHKRVSAANKSSS
jgi:hypothetical protein